jgi:hypothetical protein
MNKIKLVELHLLSIPVKSFTDFNPDKYRKRKYLTAYSNASWDTTSNDGAETVFIVNKAILLKMTLIP